jgi:Tfp pilus assembly PilM family ATPase
VGSSLYLDLGETRARILKGSAKKQRFRIDGYANLELKYPLGTSLDDERNHEIGDQIVGFLKERGLRSSRVSVLISREGIITRNARVPALERKVLDEFLHAAINEFLPVDLNEYAFDYRIMRSFSDTGDGKNYHDIMLAAVPRYMVEQVLQIMDETKMMVKSLDILPNSLFRLFANTDYGDVAILDVSQDGSRIAICEDGSLLLYADIPFGLMEMEEEAVILGL